MRPKIFNALILLIAAAVIIFTFNNYFVYDKYGKNIAYIESVDTQKTGEKPTQDGKIETYCHQRITALFKNGEYKGKRVFLENDCTSSGVYDDRYKKGNEVFVEKIAVADESGDRGVMLRGVIAGQKRDKYIAAIFVLMLALMLLIGRRQGLFTLLSLIINILLFTAVLKLYVSGINLMILIFPLILCVSALLLIMVLGFGRKALAALIAVFLTVCAVSVISLIALGASNVDYDFMDYLMQPYEEKDARMIFLAEMLIAGLGAIMDVVVMMVALCAELVDRNPQIGARALLKSCRHVGDDVLGTMLSVMLFANLAAGMPYFILALKNGIHFFTIVRYNVFFDVARFLIGSIGLVIAMPVAVLVSIRLFTHAKKLQTGAAANESMGE